MRKLPGIVGELFGFLGKRKLWWLIPMLLVLILFAVLLILSRSTSPGEVIYPLF